MKKFASRKILTKEVMLAGLCLIFVIALLFLLPAENARGPSVDQPKIKTGVYRSIDGRKFNE